jgi:hypothetical protein
MREAHFQSKLLRALRQRMPEAVIWKLSDRWTCGVPDVMVSLRGVVTWFELKTQSNDVTRIQAEWLKRLVRGHVVRCDTVSGKLWYFCGTVPLGESDIFHTESFDKLVQHLERLCLND